jgi:hypothetical protein
MCDDRQNGPMGMLVWRDRHPEREPVSVEHYASTYANHVTVCGGHLATGWVAVLTAMARAGAPTSEGAGLQGQGGGDWAFIELVRVTGDAHLLLSRHPQAEHLVWLDVQAFNDAV